MNAAKQHILGVEARSERIVRRIQTRQSGSCSKSGDDYYGRRRWLEHISQAWPNSRTGRIEGTRHLVISARPWIVVQRVHDETLEVV